MIYQNRSYPEMQVQALRFNGSNMEEVNVFVEPHTTSTEELEDGKLAFYIDTDIGRGLCMVGWWIVKSDDNAIAMYTNERFNQIYQAVIEPVPL